MLTLILGGARSGKSRMAQKMAARYQRVCYLATAPPTGDPEMIARIAKHRADRPAGWQTIEEPLALADAVERVAPGTDAVLVDCLTLWLSNIFWEHRDAPATAIEQALRTNLQRIALAAKACHVILVSNELGSGTVPDASLTRAFRDMQGLLNQWAAQAADEVLLSVAGLPLHLKAAS